MSQKILVTYTTNAGSTAEVAEKIAAELRAGEGSVDVRRLEEVTDLSPYKAVVIGAPMILGWHRGAVNFLKKHQSALSKIPVAYFLTAISLTRHGEDRLTGLHLTLDPNLSKSPKNPPRLGLRERFTTLDHYLLPVLSAAPKVKPVSVGIFGGKMDFTRLKLLQMLFVMIIIQAQPGDRRNWPAIQQWAAGLSNQFA